MSKSSAPNSLLGFLTISRFECLRCLWYRGKVDVSGSIFAQKLIMQPWQKILNTRHILKHTQPELTNLFHLLNCKRNCWFPVNKSNFSNCHPKTNPVKKLSRILSKSIETVKTIKNRQMASKTSKKSKLNVKMCQYFIGGQFGPIHEINL